MSTLIITGTFTQSLSSSDGVVGTPTTAQLAAASIRSASLAASATDRSANPAVVEAWPDLSHWALFNGDGNTQVSGGRLYSVNNAGGGLSGINRAFPVPAGGKFRIYANVRLVAASAGAGIIVGVSKDAPGAAPAQYAASAKGIYIGDAVKTYVNGNGTNIVGGSAPADDYVVTIVGDGANISVTARGQTQGFEARATIPYGADAINNVYIFNPDSRGLAGNSIGKIGFKLGSATLPRTTDIEDGLSVVYAVVNGRSLRIALPPGYDSSVGAPVVICHHGDGSNEGEFSDGEANPTMVGNALSYGGYIVLSATAPNHRTWGSNAGVEAYAEAFKYLVSNYGIGKVAMYALSMGGIESLNGLNSHEIPEVVAWAGQSPTANLAGNYANNNFTAAIQVAYGMDQANDDYAEKTAGHDPLLRPGFAERGVPMYGLAASDDAYVPAAQNWDLLKALVAPYAKEIKELAPKPIGGHAFDISPYVASIVAWFDKYAK